MALNMDNASGPSTAHRNRPAVLIAVKGNRQQNLNPIRSTEMKSTCLEIQQDKSNDESNRSNKESNGGSNKSNGGSNESSTNGRESNEEGEEARRTLQ